jgi:ESS family glutamate:Na+ symporter
MAALPKTNCPAHRAFFLVPLVSGFILDISNAMVIQLVLNWLS